MKPKIRRYIIRTHAELRVRFPYVPGPAFCLETLDPYSLRLAQRGMCVIRGAVEAVNLRQSLHLVGEYPAPALAAGFLAHFTGRFRFGIRRCQASGRLRRDGSVEIHLAEGASPEEDAAATLNLAARFLYLQGQDWSAYPGASPRIKRQMLEQERDEVAFGDGFAVGFLADGPFRT